MFSATAHANDWHKMYSAERKFIMSFATDQYNSKIIYKKKKKFKETSPLFFSNNSRAWSALA